MRKLLLMMLLFVAAQQAMAFSSTTVNQKDWRWRKDDGSQTTATWMAAKNDPANVNGIYPNQNLRLRMSFVTQNNAGIFPEGELANYEIQNGLEYATALGGPWQPISDDSANAFMLSYSSRVPAQLPVTEQLFTPAPNGYKAGRVVDVTNMYGMIGFVQSLSATVAQENEWVLRVTPNAQATTYYFRVPAAGQPDASVFPSLVVNPVTFKYAGSPFCASTGTVNTQNDFPGGGTYSSTAGISVDANTGAIDLAASNPGRYEITYTYDGGNTTSTVVDIRPQANGASGFVPPANAVACEGDYTGVAPFDAPLGLSYSWTNTNTNVGLAASGSGPVPPFAATSDGSVTTIAQINLTPTGGTGCNFKQLAYRVTVKKAPSLSSLSMFNECSGNIFAPMTASNPAGTVYNWTNNNPAAGLPAAGSGLIPAFVAQTSTTMMDEVARVRIVATYNGCTAAGINQYTVNPAAPMIAYDQPSYCQAGRAELLMKPRATGGTFSADPGLSIDPVTGTVNLGQSTPGTYTVTYSTGNFNSCNESSTTQITVNAGASIAAVPNAVYCNGIVTSPVTFSGNATSYTWTNSNPAIGLAASGTGNLPSFTTANAGPGAQYAYIKVTPQGTVTAACPGKAMAFRITVNYCGPIAQHGDTDDGNARIALDRQIIAGPNPTTGVVRVQYSGSAQQLDVLVRNSNGTVVLPARRVASNTISIDLSTLLPGTYAIQFADPRTGTSIVRTIVKL